MPSYLPIASGYTTPDPGGLAARGVTAIGLDGKTYEWTGGEWTYQGSSGISALVAPDGNLASAALASTAGTPGQVVVLSDGPDQGAKLIWAKPAGSSTYTWCWWLWPQAAY
jgi:hypothetical protein